MKKEPDIHPLQPSADLGLPLEELEARLESQLLGLPMDLEDGPCLYFFCTTRCDGTKCPVYCECNTVVQIGG